MCTPHTVGNIVLVPVENDCSDWDQASKGTCLVSLAGAHGLPEWLGCPGPQLVLEHIAQELLHGGVPDGLAEEEELYALGGEEPQ